MRKMNITDLVSVYQEALAPVFGDKLSIIFDEDYDNCVSINMDGAKEEFGFDLYGIDGVRLYWCNECFIFDRARNLFVSSDTYGEIVYEDKIDTATLPNMVIDLIYHLKDAAFVRKKEKTTGKTPFGYDIKKDYVIIAKRLDGVVSEDYVLGNICIKFCVE